MTRIRVVVMAGGTGGHVFPGLALAHALQQKNCEIAWLGTERGIEAKLVPAAGITLHHLSIQGLRGRGTLEMLKTPWRLLCAVTQVRRWLKQWRPQLVVGLGGYAAAPGGIAAWTMGVPLVIHEQNARAGTTNRLLARLAQKRLVAFANALPDSVCVGNPVREAIAQLPPRNVTPGERKHLLVLGGSLGAKAINELVPQALSRLPTAERPHVMHQTGQAHEQATREHYAGAQVEAEVVSFIDDMAQVLSWADFVICRAGALTVAEVACAGLPALFIPFPHAIDDHQTANASWLVDQDAALMRQQHELSAQSLHELLASLLVDATRLQAMGERARSAAKPDATARFADICWEVANGSR